jgi:hypothetical protein
LAQQYRKEAGEYYSELDRKSIAQINQWLDERKLSKDGMERISQAALARMSRIGVSTLSQVLSGNYGASPSKLIEQVLSAMRHAEETSDDMIPAVETSVFKLVQTACTMARRYRNFSVISAYVGTGKTFSLRYYTRNNPNTFLIEANPTFTPTTIVKKLAQTIIGHDVGGKIYDQFEAVVNAVKNTDSLIILDEAETLTPKQLELLRRIRDTAGVGVVLAGTEYLTGLIKPEHGQFDQIRSRTGFWPETVRQITKDDAIALIQAGFPSEDVADDVIDRLYAYSRGSARMLVEGLVAGVHQFRKGRDLDVKLIDAVASQALCLQAVK